MALLVTAKRRWRTTALLLLAVVAIVFHAEPQLDKSAFDAVVWETKDDEPTSCRAPSIDAVVLIDALDFGVFSNRTKFAKVDGMRSQGRVWERMLLATAPTVTLPKLRALTKGREGSFLDLVRNVGFGGNEGSGSVLCDDPRAREDVFLALSCRDGDSRQRRIAFYGDDTWLRLYPYGSGSDVFVEADGVASFDVHDVSEVDFNVTRHLEPVIEQWSRGNFSVDLVVTHLLGYDHIGHIEDPDTSARAHAKLLWYDHVVVEMHARMCSISRDATLTLLSDHGIASGGGHGGATLRERSTVFARLSCDVLPEFAQRAVQDELGLFGRSMLQVDASSMLLLNLVRGASPASLRTGLGIVPPSFAAAACHRAVDSAAFAQYTAKKEVRDAAIRASPNAATRVWSICCYIVLMLLAAGVAATEPSKLLAGAVLSTCFLEQWACFSSSVAEELPVVRCSIAVFVCSACCLPALSSVKVERWRAFGCLLIIRCVLTLTFPQGSKWRTHAASGAPQSKWASVAQLVPSSAKIGHSVLSGICDTSKDAAWMWMLPGIVLLGVFWRLAHRTAAALVVLVACVIPCTPLHATAAVIFFGCCYAYFSLTAVLPRSYRCLCCAILTDAGGALFGKSLAFSDLLFSHVMCSPLGRLSSNALVLGGAVAGAVWYCAGGLLVMSAFVAHNNWHRNRLLLQDVLRLILTRRLIGVCVTGCISAVMEGHLFHLSVFQPLLLMNTIDLLLAVVLITIGLLI